MFCMLSTLFCRYQCLKSASMVKYKSRFQQCPGLPTPPRGSPFVGAIDSNSRKSRVFALQSCSAAESIDSVTLLRGALGRFTARCRWGSARAVVPVAGSTDAIFCCMVHFHRARFSAHTVSGRLSKDAELMEVTHAHTHLSRRARRARLPYRAIFRAAFGPRLGWEWR